MILPVYKHRELYFILRCVSKAGVPILHPTLINLLDLYPPAGVEVFDLPPTYDLDPLKDLLHSGNLGAVSRELHDADVDFTQETERISGALLGVQCQQYTWYLQVRDNNRNSSLKREVHMIQSKKMIIH